VKRGAIVLALAAPLIWAPGAATAKGDIQARGYAVISGPGLSHPIVFSAPWGSSRGGYYSDDAEIFLSLANQTGAIPAGKTLTTGGGYVPDGVLPLRPAPNREMLGPAYRLTWFRDDLIVVARQDIYPYARSLPVVYTTPSSRRALIALFGRFQDPAHLWTGWGRATSTDLLRSLRGKGLPSTAPTTDIVAPGSRVPIQHSWPGPAVALSVLAIVAVLGTAAIWFLRHMRKAPSAVSPGRTTP
jgi:hypothetical protein